MVYDIGDPSDPTKPEWYQLKRHEKRWKADVGDGTTSSGKAKDRCYHAEHVLEWWLLGTFLEAEHDLNGVEQSICVLLHKYYTQQNMPKANIEVRKAKDYKKALGKDDHLKYQESKAIDWIAMQWPGTSMPSGKPPTPWEYELVLVNADLNIKKADIWEEKNIVPVPMFEEDQKTLRKNQDNSDTLKALFDNRYYEDQKDHDWPDNKGKCKAIYRFTTLMGLVTYHNDPYIREIMRAQVRRVGEAFEHLEKEVIPKLPPWKDKDNNDHKYTYVGLKDIWRNWMKARHATDLAALNKALEDSVKIFKGESSIITRIKRWDFEGLFAKRAVKVPNCGSEPDNKVIDKRVKLMLEAYDKLGKAETELKLEEAEEAEEEEEEEEQEEEEEEGEDEQEQEQGQE